MSDTPRNQTVNTPKGVKNIPKKGHFDDTFPGVQVSSKFIAAERAINFIYLFHRIADEAAISELFVKYILAVIIFFNGILRGYWLFFQS